MLFGVVVVRARCVAVAHEGETEGPAIALPAGVPLIAAPIVPARAVPAGFGPPAAVVPCIAVLAFVWPVAARVVLVLDICVGVPIPGVAPVAMFAMPGFAGVPPPVTPPGVGPVVPTRAVPAGFAPPVICVPCTAVWALVTPVAASCVADCVPAAPPPVETVFTGALMRVAVALLLTAESPPHAASSSTKATGIAVNNHASCARRRERRITGHPFGRHGNGRAGSRPRPQIVAI